MKNLEQMINETDSLLTPFPATAGKLSKYISDESAPISEIASVIQYDMNVSANVLRMANSVFSGTNRKIGSISDAIIRLGTGRILELLVGLFLKKQIKTPLPEYGYEESELWRHSVAAACAAENLNKHIKLAISGISFTAALMHDIGKIVLAPELRAHIKMFMSLVGEKNNWLEAEHHLFGFTHADIGAEIAKRWSLPLSIENAIRYHNSANGDTHPVTDSVRIANFVARVIGEGVGNEGMSMHIPIEVVERLNLTREKIELLCAETLQKYKTVLDFYDQ